MSRSRSVNPGFASFPSTRNFTGINRPGRYEGALLHLEVSGDLPEQLRGILFRCGPDPAFPPNSADDIYINGDGMVTSLELTDQGVHLRTRYVATDKLKAERSAGRRLFGAYRNPYTDDVSVAGVDRTTANTSMIWHGKRLFAIKEDGLPHELHPRTLATLGKWDFGGALKSRTVTAHPKMDPQNGEWVFFGYNAGGEFDDHIAVGTIDEHGVLVGERWILPPYQSLIHDWAVTEHHMVVPVMPLAGDEQRAKAHGPRWAWDPELITYFMVLDRDGERDPVIYQAPAMWFFHTLNAFEDDGLLHLDVCLADTAPMPDKNGAPADRARSKQYLTRLTIDLLDATAPVQQQRLLEDLHVDFPEIDQRFQTRPHRHGFIAARDVTRPINADIEMGVWFNTLIHLDLLTGETESWYAGDNSNVQEPVFIPRTDTAEEGDGYLMALVNRFPEGLTELVVVDTADFSSGPVATVHIPLHIRPTFHGLWIPENEINEPEGQA